MKQWLNEPVTKGWMIRVLLICTFLLLLLVSAIDVAFNIGGSRWTTLSATILVVLGIIIGPVGSLLVYLSSDKQNHPPSFLSASDISYEKVFEQLKKQEEDYVRTSSHSELGTLLVSARKEHRGVTVYLLSRDDFWKCETMKARAETKKVIKKTITLERFGKHLFFLARFRDVQPGRYNIWIGPDRDKPKSFLVQIEKGIVSDFDVDWTN